MDWFIFGGFIIGFIIICLLWVIGDYHYKYNVIVNYAFKTTTELQTVTYKLNKIEEYARDVCDCDSESVCPAHSFLNGAGFYD